MKSDLMQPVRRSISKSKVIRAQSLYQAYQATQTTSVVTGWGKSIPLEIEPSMVSRYLNDLSWVELPRPPHVMTGSDIAEMIDQAG